MGATIERKWNLVQAIMSTEDEQVIDMLEKTLQVLYGKDTSLKRLVRPMRETLDVEKIKREQNWKPTSREEWSRLVKELDIQEPLEDLLAMLSK